MILITDKSKKDAKRLADMFYYMGILANAESPQDIFSEISTMYKAVIISNPDSIIDLEFYIKKLYSYTQNIPLFAISSTGRCEYEKHFAYIFKHGTYPARIAEIIENICGRMSPGIYKLSGIDACAHLSHPKYFDITLPFTKTENMILKSLIKSYPVPLSSKDILKYAFRKTRTPELSNIRTHISVMNRKFKEITGRSLTSTEHGEGYTVFTPELAFM